MEAVVAGVPPQTNESLFHVEIGPLGHHALRLLDHDSGVEGLGQLFVQDLSIASGSVLRPSCCGRYAREVGCQSSRISPSMGTARNGGTVLLVGPPIRTCFSRLGARATASPVLPSAKWICLSCPVQDACLQFALETNQGMGIWGGMDEDERRRLRRRRRSGQRAPMTLVTS